MKGIIMLNNFTNLYSIFIFTCALSILLNSCGNSDPPSNTGTNSPNLQSCLNGCLGNLNCENRCYIFFDEPDSSTSSTENISSGPTPDAPSINVDFTAINEVKVSLRLDVDSKNIVSNSIYVNGTKALIQPESRLNVASPYAFILVPTPGTTYCFKARSVVTATKMSEFSNDVCVDTKNVFPIKSIEYRTSTPPSIAKDGKITYADIEGDLKLLSPNGDLLWEVAIASPAKKIDVGYNNKIYVRVDTGLISYNMQGDKLWEFFDTNEENAIYPLDSIDKTRYLGWPRKLTVISNLGGLAFVFENSSRGIYEVNQLIDGEITVTTTSSSGYEVITIDSYGEELFRIRSNSLPLINREGDIIYNNGFNIFKLNVYKNSSLWDTENNWVNLYSDELIIYTYPETVTHPPTPLYHNNSILYLKENEVLVRASSIEQIRSSLLESSITNPFTSMSSTRSHLYIKTAIDLIKYDEATGDIIWKYKTRKGRHLKKVENGSIYFWDLASIYIVDTNF